MLVLSIKNVKRCLLSHKTAGKKKIVKGIAYQDKLYVKGESYPLDRGRDAIQHSREFFLQHKGKVECLVVEGKRGFTLWYRDDHAKVVKKSKTTDVVSKVDLRKLVTKMRDIDGISIQDRRYKLNVYDRCFIGSEAVAWFRKKLKISPEQAIKLGQRLIDEDWIHHVLDKQSFADDYYFYRFYWDEAPVDSEEKSVTEKL